MRAINAPSEEYQPCIRAIYAPQWALILGSKKGRYTLVYLPFDRTAGAYPPVLCATDSTTGSTKNATAKMA